MLRCILYPRAKLFVSSGGKEQSASIIKEKVDELCNLVPALDREIDHTPGRTRMSKDYCIYMFKNKSYFDNLSANEKTRGKRRHGGLLEECVTIDGKILNEIILPVMNVSRLAMDGESHPEETLNKSQIYVTTAGWKGTFAKTKKFVGELKPLEPQNEGVDKRFAKKIAIVSANSESIYLNVTLCQAA